MEMRGRGASSKGRGPRGLGLPYLPTVGQVIHRQSGVQPQGEAEVTEAAGEVSLDQDVGALEVPVHDGHLGSAAQRVVAVQVRDATGQRAAQPAQVLPADDVARQVLLQVALGVEGGDQPVLLAQLRLALLSCQELQDVLVLEVDVREDVLLRLPGGIFFIGEDLDGHGLKLLRRVLPQLGLVDLGEAPFAHQGVQLNGQQLRVVIDVVGAGGADVGAVILQDDGQVLTELHQLARLARVPGRAQLLLPVDAVAVEGDDDSNGDAQRRQEADTCHLEDDQQQVGVVGGVF